MSGSPSWGGGATEISQLYVSVPRQPAPLPVPRLALQGFTKVQLRAQESTNVSFLLVPRQYCTVRDDGLCEVRVHVEIGVGVPLRVRVRVRCTTGADIPSLAQVFAGDYQVSVGGHQPGDELGETTSNVVTGSFKISAEQAYVVPRPDRGSPSPH